MASTQLPVENMRSWAHINGIDFHSTKLGDVEGKGTGLFSSSDLDEASTAALLEIPDDLVLSAEAVEEYAKVDQNFRQLIDLAGHHSTRGDILLYLLAHLARSRQSTSTTDKRGIAPTSWSEYVKFLPPTATVPTAWPEHDRYLLRGTSLETALDSKLAALANEFASLSKKTESHPFWNDFLWEKGSCTVDDWVLVDFWYRSRCLELPQAGHSMVPALDMANHGNEPNSYYEQTPRGMFLLRRPEITVKEGDEITISYGQNKSAAEMLFSYGFVDEETTTREITLPLQPIEDDPLGKAKVHAWDGPPTLKISRPSNNTYQWQAPFLYLMVLNEEDGLDFRVLQEAEVGQRQLRVFWQEDDVTERVGEFQALVEGHALQKVVELRVVVLIQERVYEQLETLQNALPDETLRKMVESRLVDAERANMSQTLRAMERELLETMSEQLESRKMNLLQDENVLAYLGSTADAQTEQAPGASDNGDDDFS